MQNQFQRKIIHLDMDAFYTSIEQREDSRLLNCPVVVARSAQERGVVSASSYEARKYAIYSGMPTSVALEKCKDLIVLTPRMDLYKSVSQDLMNIFKTLTPIIEPIAFDEAFMDITALATDWTSAEKIAKALQIKVLNEIGLSSSIGLSFNKFLAKLGSAYKKPYGCTIIDQHNFETFIDDTPIRKIFGIGKVTEQRLLKMGITNGKELKEMEELQLVKILKKRGHTLYNNIRGLDTSELKTTRMRKSLGKEKTFHKDINDEVFLQCEIRDLTILLHSNLKETGLLAKKVKVKIRFSDFSEKTKNTTCLFNLEDPEILCEKVMLLFRAILERNLPVRKIAVYFTGLYSATQVEGQQRFLFS